MGGTGLQGVGQGLSKECWAIRSRVQGLVSVGGKTQQGALGLREQGRAGGCWAVGSGAGGHREQDGGRWATRSGEGVQQGILGCRSLGHREG